MLPLNVRLPATGLISVRVVVVLDLGGRTSGAHVDPAAGVGGHRPRAGPIVEHQLVHLEIGAVDGHRQVAAVVEPHDVRPDGTGIEQRVVVRPGDPPAIPGAVPRVGPVPPVDHAGAVAPVHRLLSQRRQRQQAGQRQQRGLPRDPPERCSRGLLARRLHVATVFRLKKGLVPVAPHAADRKTDARRKAEVFHAVEKSFPHCGKTTARFSTLWKKRGKVFHAVENFFPHCGKSVAPTARSTGGVRLIFAMLSLVSTVGLEPTASPPRRGRSRGFRHRRGCKPPRPRPPARRAAPARRPRSFG
jgi:hypothetical protein